VDVAKEVPGHNPIPGPGAGRDPNVVGKHRQTLASFQIPDPHSLVVGAGDGAPTIGRQRHGPAPTRVAFQYL
jgi:hypothetical protein